MKMISFECPKCKANLKIEADKKMAFCLYCGHQIYLDDEVKRSEHIERKIDDARIKEAETKKVLKLKELEYKERTDKREKKYSAFLLLFLFLISIGLIFVGTWFDKQSAKEAARMESQGYLSAGNYYDYTEKNYEAVKAQLTALGFTNIENIELDDVWAISSKKNTVDTISINGNSSFKKSDYFMPDAKVIITYH